MSGDNVPGVLWGHPLSFASQKAMLALEEKGIPYNLQKINILVGDNFGADYIKINDHATVPTLFVDGKKITDSTEVLRYADGVGEPLGGDKIDKTKVEEWYSKQTAWDDNVYTYACQGASTSLFISNFRLNVLEARKAENPDLSSLYDAKLTSLRKLVADFQNKEVVDALHNQLIEILDSAEAQLQQSPYLAGEAFSMADVVLMTILNRVESLKKQELIEPRHAVSKFWLNAKNRPSYKKVMAPVVGLKSLPTILGVVANITFRKLLKKY